MAHAITAGVDDMPPKVSIVIPAYNSGSLLLDTLCGIRGQSFQDFEIIVVDDGSTDNTQEIATSTDPNIRFYRQSNQGPAVARNRGVNLAHGEFIAFCDHDDIWNERHLETLLAVFVEKPFTAMVFDNAIHCGLDPTHGVPHNMPGQEKSLVSGPVTIKQIWQCCVASMSVVMVRKKSFEKLGGLHPKIWGLDDLHFYLRLASHYTVRFVDYDGCRKRTTGQNLLPMVGLEGQVKCLEDIRAHHPEVVRAIGGFRYRLRLARKYRKLARRCVSQDQQFAAYQYFLQAYRLNVLNVSILKQLWRAGGTGATIS
jgi:glycosyltransferase involved in cell wall biosynthesis